MFLSGLAGAGLYCASKYTMRGTASQVIRKGISQINVFTIGISESLHLEISPLGLRSIIFEPGYFRTDFLTDDNRAPWISRILDYEPITTETHQGLVGMYLQLGFYFVGCT